MKSKAKNQAQNNKQNVVVMPSGDGSINKPKKAAVVEISRGTVTIVDTAAKAIPATTTKAVADDEISSNVTITLNDFNESNENAGTPHAANATISTVEISDETIDAIEFNNASNTFSLNSNDFSADETAFITAIEVMNTTADTTDNANDTANDESAVGEGSPAKLAAAVKPEASENNRPKQRPLICYIFDPRTWFNPKALDPRIESLIYWRNTKRTGFVFGAGVILLMMLSCLSVISIVANLALCTLTIATALKVYAKLFRLTGEDCPVNKFFGSDWNLAPERIVFSLGLAVKHLNMIISKLRDLLLVKHFGHSLKFGTLLFGLTYIGAWFNGVTLLLLFYIMIFSLPKLYEDKKELIREKFGEFWSELKDICAKLSMLNPVEEPDKTVKEPIVNLNSKQQVTEISKEKPKQNDKLIKTD